MDFPTPLSPIITTFAVQSGGGMFLSLPEKSQISTASSNVQFLFFQSCEFPELVQLNCGKEKGFQETTNSHKWRGSAVYSQVQLQRSTRQGSGGTVSELPFRFFLFFFFFLFTRCIVTSHQVSWLFFSGLSPGCFSCLVLTSVSPGVSRHLSCTWTAYAL